VIDRHHEPTDVAYRNSRAERGRIRS
jgi:hypothetical protein